MAQEQLILVVDDDPHILEVVRFALEKGGFRTAEAGDGREALTRFHELKPDLIILDVMMKEMDGTDVCRSIRAISSVPIVFLSSKDDEIDRIIGLELGGDDYVSKPFSPRELVARVRAVLRRWAAAAVSSVASPQPAGTVTYGRLVIDTDRFQAFWGECQVVLTVTEFGILRTLLGYPGKVFTRDELIAGAYSNDTYITDRTIDSHVRRIRRKFNDAGGDPVETVHGVGYKLGPCR
ncbi:response regulator transcription factor [Geobacter sp. AOG1]|uniref:response regulator transcription factor n=1 Tax=Geobacter sp. AOG1 TaxID=1566346 RepID=UPI001CC604C7|nr:response regulator transcription factor [Geobacter sp. AOG1]GFE59265.1 DNA-binding response regulator [Geobacter sp. AOG1]